MKKGKLQPPPEENESDIIFETVDRYNTIVSLSRATGEGKILVYHPEVADYLQEAQTVIEEPNVIIVDSLRETTWTFAKLGLGKDEFKGLYLRTIVQYAGVGGRVASVYFTDDLPKGRLKWIEKK